MNSKKAHGDKENVYLTPAEKTALQAAPDCTTWEGRRDRTLLYLAILTGMRVSELIGMRCQDLRLRNEAFVCIRFGKGGKGRCLTIKDHATAAMMRSWKTDRGRKPGEPLFPATARGGALSRADVRNLVIKYAAIAQHTCPSLMDKQISFHMLRHTSARDLLRAGADPASIAERLGHAS